MPSPRSIVNLIFCEWKLLGRVSITCCTPCFQQSSALTLALALDLACKHHRFSFTFKLRIEETSSSNKTFKTDWKRLLQEYWNLQTCNYSIGLQYTSMIAEFWQLDGSKSAGKPSMPAFPLGGMGTPMLKGGTNPWQMLCGVLDITKIH